MSPEQTSHFSESGASSLRMAIASHAAGLIPTASAAFSMGSTRSMAIGGRHRVHRFLFSLASSVIVVVFFMIVVYTLGMDKSTRDPDTARDTYAVGAWPPWRQENSGSTGPVTRWILIQARTSGPGKTARLSGTCSKIEDA